MNIKFRMPRLGNKLKGQSMLKEMAMTIIATTISIVLTFGTASIIEKQQKEKNRRLTAVMVLANIEEFYRDNCILLEIYQDHRLPMIEHVLKKREENGGNFNNVPEDTLKYWFKRIKCDDVYTWRDRTAEQIFSSNIETWNNVSNFEFIAKVGAAYTQINEFHSEINEWNNIPQVLLAEKQKDCAPSILYTSLFNSNSFYYYMIEAKEKLKFFEGMLNFLKEKEKDGMQMMGIANEEIEQALKTDKQSN